MSNDCQLMGGRELESPLVFVPLKTPLSPCGLPSRAFTLTPEQDTFVLSVVVSCRLMPSRLVEKSGRRLGDVAR